MLSTSFLIDAFHGKEAHDCVLIEIALICLEAEIPS